MNQLCVGQNPSIHTTASIRSGFMVLLLSLSIRTCMSFRVLAPRHPTCSSRFVVSTEHCHGIGRRFVQDMHAGASPSGGTTQYTLDDSVCPPTNSETLSKVVGKHCRTLDSYLENKPIASHTQEAFDQVKDVIQSLQASGFVTNNKMVLDSGCGTARSTLLLGNLYPDHVVIGIDRSLARLNRNTAFRKDPRRTNDSNEKENGDPVVQVVSSNVILVRAELSDFWRLCLLDNWTLSHHYLLYPNPYPKPKRLQSRWYGHPSFPLILQLGGHLHVRSNWLGYLQEFAQSVLLVDAYWQKERQNQSGEGPFNENYANQYVEAARYGPLLRQDMQATPLTNFEQKYQHCREPTYELDLYMKFSTQ